MKITQQEIVAFVINPISGRKKGLKVDKFAKKYLLDIYKPEFYYSEFPGHAKEICEELKARGIKIIVAVGGDGTINEVASAMVDTDVTLGIIPTGSGNGLARHLEISTKIKKSIKVLNQSRIIQIDVGKIKKHYFFSCCGMGFDAAVSEQFDNSKKRGLISYILIVIAVLGKYKTRKQRILIDGSPVYIRPFILTFSMGNQFGNNFKIAPSANIYDGWIDVAILKPFPKIKTLSLFIKLLRGKIDKSKYYKSYRVRKIEITKGKKHLFHIDGDPHILEQPIKISILEQKLNVMVPMRFLA